MTCDAFRSLASAYVDGELTGDDRSAFEAHVRGCEACRLRLTEEQAVVAALAGAVPLYEASSALRQRVDALLKPRPARRPWLFALAATLLVATATSLAVRRPGPAAAPPASRFAALAADTHLRYARGQLPLEIASDRPEAISRWFGGRVPFQLQLPDYPVGPGREKPYRLEGGRLVSFRDDYAAYVAYRMGEQPISLLVTSASAATPAGGSTVTSGALTFHLESVAGLKVITWSDNGLTYALASDVAVEGARSCVVCHGSEEERRKLERFPGRPGA